MDAGHFDHLTHSLAAFGTRRGLLAVLAAVPVVGGLFAQLEDDAGAKGRRKRRKKPHHHRKKTGNRAGNKKQRRCKPESKAKTCAGKCGSVKNNCKKTVDCGSCACNPPCDVCFTCQEGPNTPGACVPDPDQGGEACGEPGQVCQRDGSCACSSDPASCPACTTCGADGTCQGCTGCCDGGTCVADCGDCQVCDHGQCVSCPNCCDAAGVCQEGTTDAACGSGGDCDVCTGQEECQDQSCVCVPVCDGKVCGSDGCDGQCGPGCDACETCLGNGTCSDPCGGSGCCAGTTCERGDSNTACGRNGEACGSCSGTGVTCGGGGTPGVCGCTPTTCLAEGKNCGTIADGCGSTLNCGSCDANGATPICSGNICVACSANNPCPGGCCQADGSCGGACRVFTSSTISTGNLDGLAGADATCQRLAEAAGLPGTYLAWLSDPSGSPSTRFPLAGSPTAGPYVLIGTPVATIASDWNNLTTRVSCFDGSGGPCIDHHINRNETGAAVTSPFVAWTGTEPNGAQGSPGHFCNNWTNGTSAFFGWIGQPDVVNHWWSLTFATGCNNRYHLFCFQQG